MAKKAAKKRVTKKPAARRKRKNPGVVEDIPTISASTLRSSVSAQPAPAGDALITKVAPAAGPMADKMLDTVKFRIYNESDDVGEDYNTLEAAIVAAKAEGAEVMDNNDSDDADIEIWQLVGIVAVEKVGEVKSTVSLVGSSPA